MNGIVYTVPGLLETDDPVVEILPLQGSHAHQLAVVLIYAYAAGCIVRTDVDENGNSPTYQSWTEIVDPNTFELIAGDELDYPATVKALSLFHGAIPVDTAMGGIEKFAQQQASLGLVGIREALTAGVS